MDTPHVRDERRVAPPPDDTGETAGSPRLLIVDDDGAASAAMVSYLELERFDVRAVGSARDMRHAFEADGLDAILLDLILPDDSGWNALRWLRARSDIPIIIVTAKGATVDKVVGLELGADDYLVKPFEIRELVARLNSVLRRTDRRRPAADTTVMGSVKFAGWTLDFTSLQLNRDDGERIHLTQAEYRLLSLLVRHPNRVVGRDELVGCLGMRDWDPLDRSVDVRISKLRSKIDLDPQLPSLIRTVRGTGYMFVPEQGEPAVPLSDRAPSEPLRALNGARYATRKS
jgi:DNA-binding response OmpR family regulator